MFGICQLPLGESLKLQKQNRKQMCLLIIMRLSWPGSICLKPAAMKRCERDCILLNSQNSYHRDVLREFTSVKSSFQLLRNIICFLKQTVPSEIPLDLSGRGYGLLPWLSR